MYLVGQAGSGKTRVLKEIASMVLNNKMESDVNAVIFIQCQMVNTKKKKHSLYHFLLSMSQCLCSANLVTQLEDMKKKHILIVIDSLEVLDAEELLNTTNSYDPAEELTAYDHISNLLLGNVFKDAKKICATSNSFLFSLRMKYHTTTVVSILPLNEEAQHNLLLSLHPNDCQKVKSEIASLGLSELCKTPFLLLIVVHCLKELSFPVPNDSKFSYQFCKMSGILLTYLQCSYNRLCFSTKSTRGKENIFIQQVLHISKLAWEMFESGQLLTEDQLSNLLVEVQGRFFTPKTNFQAHIMFSNSQMLEYFAAIYVMTQLPIDKFRKVITLENMKQDKWKVFSKCLFGLWNTSLNEVSWFAATFRNKAESGKYERLLEITRLAAEHAKKTDMYDDCIQSLFQLGSWMQEATSENNLSMLDEAAQHLQNRVTLADKITLNDVKALMYLMAHGHKEKEISLGIMSSPRFLGDDTLTTLFEEVYKAEHIKMTDVDLRGNTITGSAARSIAKCVHKIKVLNLCSTAINLNDMNLILQEIGNLHKIMSCSPLKMEKLQLEERALDLSDELSFSFGSAVQNINELRVVCKSFSPTGWDHFTRGLGQIQHKLRLDIGMSLLTTTMSRQLAKCLNKLESLHLRGCLVETGSIRVLTEKIKSSDHKLQGLFLDNIDLKEDDIDGLSDCLDKFSSWLAIIYCNVTATGYTKLKDSFEALAFPNFLEISLGDVDGVGESVTIKM